MLPITCGSWKTCATRWDSCTAGKILFQKELAELQQDFAKIQFAAKPLPDKAAFEQLVDIISFHASGNVAEIVAHGNPHEVEHKLSALNPLLCESVPLTLEEIFITEMEAVGYDYNNVIF